MKTLEQVREEHPGFYIEVFGIDDCIVWKTEADSINDDGSRAIARYKLQSAPLCGFCGAKVSGDVTSLALPSEAFVAHPDSYAGPLKNGEREVFSCEDGKGCMK